MIGDSAIFTGWGVCLDKSDEVGALVHREALQIEYRIANATARHPDNHFVALPFSLPPASGPKYRLTYQTITFTLLVMFDTEIRRLFDAYPAIYLACHRRHVTDDETGKSLTGHQVSILDHLHRTRPMSLSTLAEHMGIGRSAMSIAVSKLVKRHYVTRVRAPHDARSIALTLTVRGEGIRDNNSFLDHQLVRSMFRRLSSKELDAALSGLEILAKSANILLRQRSRTRKS